MVRGALSVRPRLGKPHFPTTLVTFSSTWAMRAGSMVGRVRGRARRVHIEHTT